MGWRVKQYADGKFGLWSTIVDRYVLRKTHRENVIKFIERAWRRDLNRKIKELRKDFPEGWPDKDHPFERIFNKKEEE